MIVKRIGYITLKNRIVSLRDDSLYVNSIYYLIYTIIVAGFGFVFWWFSARFYLDEVLGKFVIVLTTAQLITTLANLGLSFSIIRFFPKSEYQRTTNINFTISIVILAAIALSLIAVLAGLLGYSPLSVLVENTLMFPLFILFVLFLGTFQLLYPILACLSVARILMWTGLFSSLGRIILLFLFARKSSLQGLMIIYIIPLLIAVLLHFVIIIPKIVPSYSFHFHFTNNNWKEYIKYSLGNYISNFLHDLPGLSIPHIVANNVNFSGAAHFYIVWSIYGLITTLGNSFPYSLFVEGSSNAKNIDQLTRKTIFSVIGFSTLLIVPILLWSKPILQLFGSNYLANGTAALRVMALASIPAAVVYTSVSSLRVKMRLQPIIVVFALIASISISLLLFINIKSLIFVGWVWLISQSIACIYVVFWKNLHMN